MRSVACLVFGVGAVTRGKPVCSDRGRVKDRGKAVRAASRETSTTRLPPRGAVARYEMRLRSLVVFRCDRESTSFHWQGRFFLGGSRNRDGGDSHLGCVRTVATSHPLRLNSSSTCHTVSISAYGRVSTRCRSHSRRTVESSRIGSCHTGSLAILRSELGEQSEESKHFSFASAGITHRLAVPLPGSSAQNPATTLIDPHSSHPFSLDGS